jgi:hypothetical protein
MEMPVLEELTEEEKIQWDHLVKHI